MRARLLGCFALVLGLMLALTIYSLWTTRGIDAALSANSEQNSVIQRAAIHLRGSVHDRAIALRDLVSAAHDSARQAVRGEIARLTRDYAQLGERLATVLRLAGDRVPPEVPAMLEAIGQNEKATLAIAQDVTKALEQGDASRASALV